MNLKNLVLGIGIFILYMLMLVQGIEVFYESPQSEDYCGKDEGLERIGLPEEISEKTTPECWDEFDNANEAYQKIVFVIALVAGLATLVVGYFVLSVEPVGSALIASGVGAIFYGSVQNWRNFGDIWRFLLLALALIFLIWLALRSNKKKKK